MTTTSDSRYQPPASFGSEASRARTTRDRFLPFTSWWPLLAGATAGILMRAIVFSGSPGNAFAAMMGSFIYLSPLAVGAVTVYCAERIARRSWFHYFAAGFLANVIYVVGSLMALIEGIICAILIVPMFAMLGGVGGLLMGIVCRMTNWPKQAIVSVVLLPVLLGYLEQYLPLPVRIGEIERSAMIDASPASIWQEIHFTPNIDAADVENAFVYRIGAPLPTSGVTAATDVGHVRTVTMSKGVSFEQHFVEWDEPRRARWTYEFNEDSFPPEALDEHVVIGGHYFDVEQGTFTLTPVGDRTLVTMTMRYRISTQFNWYVDPIARLLMGNLADTVLEYYKAQSEQPREH